MQTAGKLIDEIDLMKLMQWLIVELKILMISFAIKLLGGCRAGIDGKRSHRSSHNSILLCVLSWTGHNGPNISMKNVARKLTARMFDVIWICSQCYPAVGLAYMSHNL